MTNIERLAVGLVLMNTASLLARGIEPSGVFDAVMIVLSWALQTGIGAWLFFSAFLRKYPADEKEPE